MSRERGTVALEMAIVAPILLLLVFGIMESGWFFAQQVEINNAAREGGRLAVVDYGTAAEIADENLCSCLPVWCQRDGHSHAEHHTRPRGW